MMVWNGNTCTSHHIFMSVSLVKHDIFVILHALQTDSSSTQPPCLNKKKKENIEWVNALSAMGSFCGGQKKSEFLYKTPNFLSLHMTLHEYSIHYMPLNFHPALNCSSSTGDFNHWAPSWMVKYTSAFWYAHYKLVTASCTSNLFCSILP